MFAMDDKGGERLTLRDQDENDRSRGKVDELLGVENNTEQDRR